MQAAARRIAGVLKLAGLAVASVGGAYLAYAAVTWLRYGTPAHTRGDQGATLDRFMAAYEVVERHHIQVGAPPELTLTAAKEQDLEASPIVRAIFKTREVVLGGTKDETVRPKGLVAVTQSLGWGVLTDVPGREIVMGAVTRPWEANVVFRALPAGEFASFNEPGYVKIVWNLRADPDGRGGSIFRTETRAVSTDAVARGRFRKYWSFASPGIAVIRRSLLRPLKHDAERRAAMQRRTAGGA